MQILTDIHSMGKLETFSDGDMGIAYIDLTNRHVYVAFFDS